MKLIITTLLSFFTLTTVGQFIEHYVEFPDLFDLYTFEKYEKCLKKAVRYTDQDKYRREPRPYLYAAKCYLKIYNDPEKYDQYIEEKPLKQSLRYANRLRRRDETGAVTGNETVFFKDLKQAGIKEALYQARQDEFRKSAYFLKYLGKVFPEDYMVQFTLAMAQRMSRNRYEAERNFTKALGLLYEDIKDNSFKAIDSDLREPVSLYLAEYLKFLEKQKKDSDYLQTLALSHLMLGDGRELETALKEL